MEQRVYIDSATAAGLLGMTERAVRKRVNTGKLTAETVEGLRGGAAGTTHAISLSEVLEAAPIENRLRWYEQQARSKISVTGADLTTYAERLGPEALEVLAKRQQAVLATEGILSGIGRGKNAALEELAAQMGCTTRTLRRWHAAYMEGGLAAIMDKVERRDKGQSKSLCSLARDLVEARMCDNHKHPQNSVLEDLQRIARECGIGACDECPYCEWARARRELAADELDKFPQCSEAGDGLRVPDNRHAINRFVRTIPDAQLYYARYGRRAWEAKFMQKCKRTRAGMLVNTAWFGDHKKLDLFVQDEQGRIVRPWLTAWMDAVSGRFVGWCLTLEPNSDTIAESFCRAVVYKLGSEVYGLPCTIYIDNGKDYRSTRFEGSHQVEYELGHLNADFYEKGLLQTLGVEVIHAKAYHGWPKTIERAWETLDRWIRYFPGWCGDSPAERPEDNSRIIKRLVDTGKLMTFETFARCFAEDVLPKYHAFAGVDGVSPDELYKRGERARQDVPDWATLAMLKSLRTTRAVSTQGIRLDKTLYWSPALADVIGQRVTVLYSRGYNPSVTVISDGAFLCEATPLEELRMVGEQPEKIARHIAQQKGQERAVTERIRRVQQATGRVYREMYTEAIDEQRTRQAANVVSIEARRAASEKSKISARASGTHSSAAGEKRMRDLLIAEGKRVLQSGAR